MLLQILLNKLLIALSLYKSRFLCILVHHSFKSSILCKQSITIRLGAVNQSPYTEDIGFSTGGFLYGREA